MATKKPGEWFRRVEETAEQYMKRWFDADKEHVAKRRSLEVHPAELSKTSLNPRPGGGGIGAALKGAWQQRPVKKVKEAAETWHWPSF